MTVENTQEFASTKAKVDWQKIRQKEPSGKARLQLLLENTSTLSSFQSNWREGFFSTALEQEQLVKGVATLYTFKDYVPVANFLRENTFLLDLLIEAWGKIREYFGRDVSVALEVFADPEAKDSRQLVALIRTNLPLQEEVDLLETLYDEWWLDELPTAQCKLHIDVE